MLSGILELAKKLVREALNGHIRDGLIAGLTEEREGRVSFLQIGGNDGALADPLLPWHSRYEWYGAIVEPVIPYFSKLTELHKNTNRIRLMNCAVSDREGTLDIWHLDPNVASKYPAWTAGIASTDLQHLVRHGVKEEDCVVAQVPCITPNQLVSELQLPRIDLLCVDIEGHEFPVLTSFPFETMEVTLTIFEAWHMKGTERAALKNWCAERSLRVFFIWEDALIVRKQDVVRTGILHELELFLERL